MSNAMNEANARATTVALAKVAERWNLPKVELYKEFAKHYAGYMEELAED